MEQKTFLAIVLSFIFLLSYNALVIAPQQKSKLSQHLVNKSVETNFVAPDSPVSTTPQTIAEDAAPSKTFTDSFNKIEFSQSNGEITDLYSNAYNYSSPLTHFFSFPATFQGYRQNADSSQFSYETDYGQVIKTIQPIDVNKSKINIRIEPATAKKLENFQLELFQINIHKIKHDLHRMKDNALFEYSLYLNNQVVRKGGAFKFSSKENKSDSAALGWAGWRDRYHFVVAKPEFETKGYAVTAIDDHRLSIAVNTGELNLQPGKPKEFEFTLYVGPQDLNLLRNLDENIVKIMAFSGFGFLDFIEKTIYKTLLLMNKFIPNWGICIILISVLIYAATYPLTFKSMMSMRKMQQLQPKMTELREKYKDNPQKLNAEVVQLYKTHNINPLSGCFPMLLQMPVFISLYQVLWRTHNFQGADFLWIKDLSQPDRLFKLPIDLPFFGNYLNLLPLLMMIVMFFQQKLSAKNIVVTDPAQEMQQKMMTFMMPVLIGGLFYHFASGLTLYFTVFYLMSTLTQLKMSKIK